MQRAFLLGSGCPVAIDGWELGEKLDLNRPRIIIGRSSKADIQIVLASVSRHHCVIMNTGNARVLRPAQS